MHYLQDDYDKLISNFRRIRFESTVRAIYFLAESFSRQKELSYFLSVYMISWFDWWRLLNQSCEHRSILSWCDPSVYLVEHQCYYEPFYPSLFSSFFFKLYDVSSHQTKTRVTLSWSTLLVLVCFHFSVTEQVILLWSFPEACWKDL